MTIDGGQNSGDELEDKSLNTGSDKVYQNYMMPGLELYDAKVSINHWQLRDCVRASTRDPGKLYYIYDHSIRSLDTTQAGPQLASSQYRHHHNHHHKSSRLRRNSANCAKRGGASSSISRRSFHAPSQLLADFNFKPRCFTESQGLVACGGLVGPDDKGFPTNWSRLSQEINNGEALDAPAEPVKLAHGNVLADHSNYSNPNIWKGVLSLYNEDTDVASSFVLGQFINNCVTLHPRSTREYDLYSCNNDGHLYQCNIDNRGVELVRRYSDLKFALNNVAVSHDAKTMVASGDSNKFAIYRQTELAGQFSLSYDSQPGWGSSVVRAKRIPRFALPDGSGFVDHIYESSSGDHGFYNCFSENDLQFATLFQNGSCLVYDVRNMDTPLADITSTRPHSHNGAFRVCKFSYGLDDLLFISEHQGRVHVVDTRNFMNHQVILVPDKLKNDPTQGGTAVSTGLENEMEIIGETSRSRNDTPLIPAVSPSGSVASFAANASRRHSMAVPPSFNNLEPWLTSATQLPLRFLEPQIVPYPKALNKLTNFIFSQQQDDIPQDQLRGAISREGSSRRRSSFRVRRFSTSSNMSEGAGETLNDRPLMERQQQQQRSPSPPVDSYNYPGQRTGIFARGSSGSTFDAEDIYDSYADINSDGNTYSLTGAFGTPSMSNYAVDSAITYPDTDFTEENNIAGIDWVEDSSGSSLIIGTDYGIMKWNINSWARRSFSSYDFC
ncbi:YLR149C [Zygosaccharomyces parabailii]|nr:YLR149C [Zygosaccharomyces parabailii]